MKRIFLKSAFIFTALLLLCATMINAQNSLKVADVTAGPGDKSNISIELNNTGNVVGFQFTLTVPSGLIVSEKAVEFTSRKADHIVYPKKINATQYLFISYSPTNEFFSGNSGTLLEIPVELPVGFQPGTTYPLSLSGVILSSVEGTDIGSDHQNGTLTVGEAKTPDLEVSGVVIGDSEISPSGTISVSWGVKNIGNASASGGWTEQITLVSDQTGDRYLLGSVSYAGEVAIGETVSRNGKFNIPKIPGMDGNVKVEVNVIPNAAIKELDSDKGNNKALSSGSVALSKLIYLSLNQTQVDENTASPVRATLTRSGFRTSAGEFQVSCSMNDQLTFPATVTIGENQSSAVFDIQPVDNNIADGNRTVSVAVSGNGYPEASQNLTIIDNEAGIITLTSSKYSVTDGDQITITLQTDIARTQDMTIALTADQPTRWNVPSTVILPAESQTVTFQVGIKTMTTAEPAVTGKITAKADGYKTGTVEINFASSNIPAFDFTIDPVTISEGDGIYATYAVIKRLDNPQASVTLRLSADVTNQLILPASVNFPAGVTQQKFNIGAVDNDIVDGTRTVTVTASVNLPSCGCTAGAGIDGATLSQTITILDNDGLALKLKATPSTVKAGITNASKITISRNTLDFSESVNLRLSSDMPSVVSIPATATIPAGQASVDVNITTMIDPEKKGDQTVRIQAEADNYTTGFAWILVSDQNKPDATVAGITANSPLAGGGNAEITATVANQGNNILVKGSKVEYYLSKSKNTQDGTLLATAELSSDIESGGQLEFVKTIQLPDKAGDYYIIVVLNSDRKIDELSFANNQGELPVKLTPAYSATVATDKTLYKSEEAVTVSGIAKYTDNTPAANKDIEVVISNNSGFVRTYTVTTNGSGNYTCVLQTLPGENGHYIAAAGYPGADGAQTEFDVAGFEWKNKPSGYLIWEVVEFSSLQGEFSLKNNTNVKLSNVKIVLPDNQGFTLNATPIDIPAGATVSLPYTIVPAAPTAGQDYVKIPAQLVSDEGACLNFTGWFYCHSQTAKLISDPVSINTTMTQGSTRYYEINLINGSVEAKDVKINIPSIDWLTLVSPQTIPSIAPYDTVKVVLQFKPTDRLQLNVPLSGTIAIGVSNGTGFQIPFKVETVSEETGSIQVDATDDYTYNTESAPHLAGASVIIRHPFSGAIIAQGLTNSAGLFTADNIPAGNYTISVTADKHNNYQNNIVIDPGRVNPYTVFLPYQAISYTWTVVPTEIEDQYQSDITVTFETNVPRPVVLFDYDKTPIDLQPGESKMLDIVVTNVGLIKAVDVNIIAPTADGYTFTLLTDYIPTLNAKSSVTIPLLIKKNSAEFRDGAIAGCIAAAINGYFLVLCGPEHYEDIMTGKIPLYSNASDCSLPGIFEIIGGGGDKSGGSGPGSPGSGDCFDCGDKPGYGEGAPGTYNTGLGCNQCTDELLRGLASAGVGGGPGTLKDALGFAKDLGDNLDCFNGPNPPLIKKSSLRSTTELSFKELMQQDMAMVANAAQAMENKDLLIYMDANFVHSDNFTVFENEVASYINNQQAFSETDILSLKTRLAATSIENSYIDNFCSRWNLSLEAWNNGVKSPDAQYPDIIDKNLLDSYNSTIAEAYAYAIDRGFSSLLDMFMKDLDDLNLSAQEDRKNSVCATVTVKFSQTITMTREAFEGTLTLNNGGDAGTITDVNLDLTVYDENGEDATYLFQVNKDDFLSGSGSVGINSSGTGTVIFIPTKMAAPTVPLSYSFGGTLSYTDPGTGEKVTAKLFPVTLQVNPSPDLVLHYFMQRDILGDDPLTEDVVEPSVPAELALMIVNEGYGTAKNVKVESMQPEIVDNQKGLLIDFNITGSSFNNEPKQLGLLNINFGDIEPMKSAVGQWWFTSSLMGHFIDYQINVTHLSSFGNKNLSLIKDYQLHELIKSVKGYGAGQDDINDFLVNDIPDVNNTPDRIYYSNGGSDDVYAVTGASASNLISASQLTATLLVTPYMTGWNYGKIADPGTNQYKLVKVVRNSDSYELPMDNFWQTFVTMKDGSSPKYENNLHFLDKITTPENYTLYYAPIDTGYPKVVAFENIPEEMATQPVENVNVKFNKPIDPTTFTTDNIQLVYQGDYLPTDNILIGKIDSVTYSLNLQAVTVASGYYQLTVQCVGIKDTVGNEGQTGKSADWIQVMGELGIISLSTDQLKSEPVNSVAIFFNKSVAPNQFTKDKVTLNGEPLGDNVSIITEDNYHYTILGLSEYNNISGSYELSVNLPAIKSENNIAGIVAQSCKWRVDVVMPAVKYFTPVYQGAVNNQNITNMLITLTKPVVNDLDATWLTLYKGSVNQNALLSVSKTDSIHFLISGLGDYTYTSGGYRLSVDQTGLVDELGNVGVGQVDTTWVVSIAKPASITLMRITPDRGISNSDNITSGNDLSISFTTTANQEKIALYAVSSQGETLITEQYVENAGAVNIPVSGYSGKITFKAIVSDAYGNQSDPVSIDVFIDNQDLGAEIIPVKTSNSGCPDELSYISVVFTDDIQASEFTNAALSLSAGGSPLSTANLVITPVTNKEFKVENFDGINNNGDITFGVNLAALHKLSSGLQTQGTITQNLGNISIYSTQISGIQNVSLGDVTTYTASSGMLDYTWRATGGDIAESQLNSVSVRWNTLGTQTVSLVYTTPNNCVKTTELQVNVMEGTPVKLSWQGGVSADWNNYMNWEQRQAPTAIDTVVISRVTLGNYFPVLENPASVAEIHFEPGAQIGNQHWLDGKAFVSYDFSRLDSRNRWNMLSMPLGQAYPGDFAFGGYPVTWVRTFETVNKGSLTEGTWVTAKGRTTPLSFGDGFVLWLNEDNPAADKGLQLLGGIHELPFFPYFIPGSEKYDLYKKVNQAHEYDKNTGQSTFHNFDLVDGEYVVGNISYTVARNDSAYLLLKEDFSKDLNFLSNGEAGEGYFDLVGNPYMAGLDFDALSAANENVIKPCYQIWTGKGYESYSPYGASGFIGDNTLDNHIAPLQAFLVEKPESPESNTLRFTEAMTGVNNPVSLRSSTNGENKLEVVAENPVAGVLAFIARREGGQDGFGNLDARKIMNGISDVPDIYTLKPYKDGAVAVGANIINSDEQLIPVGLATSYTGEITLSFSGMDTYDAKLSLIDAEAKKEIDLTGLAFYDYPVDYTPKQVNGETAACEDRFFIRISKSETGLQETSTGEVNVFEANGIIHVVSGIANPIKEVAVYSLQGALMYRATGLNTISHTIDKHWFTGAYVVKVFSEKNTGNFKLIIH